MPRIGVTSTIFHLLPYLKAELLDKSPDCRFYTGQPPITEDWLIDFLDGCEAAVIGVEKYTERVISSHPQLKVLACCSVGVDHIDPAVLKKHKVRLG